MDSAFDVNYELDFVGAPGSPLDGFSGTTAGMVTMEAQDVGLDSGEQKCVNSLNKAGWSVVNAQLKAASGCIKSAASTIPGAVNVNVCKNDDTKGKVGKALAKLDAAIQSSCQPPVAYSTVFPGDCSGAGSAAALLQCMDEKMRCRA